MNAENAVNRETIERNESKIGKLKQKLREMEEYALGLEKKVSDKEAELKELQLKKFSIAGISGFDFVAGVVESLARNNTGLIGQVPGLSGFAKALESDNAAKGQDTGKKEETLSGASFNRVVEPDELAKQWEQEGISLRKTHGDQSMQYILQAIGLLSKAPELIPLTPELIGELVGQMKHFKEIESKMMK